MSLFCHGLHLPGTLLLCLASRDGYGVSPAHQTGLLGRLLSPAPLRTLHVGAKEPDSQDSHLVNVTQVLGSSASRLH